MCGGGRKTIGKPVLESMGHIRDEELLAPYECFIREPSNLASSKGEITREDMLTCMATTICEETGKKVRGDLERFVRKNIKRIKV